MNNILIKMLSFLILCSLVIACDNKDEYEGQATGNIDFTVSAGYLKLSEDSANIAGVLRVTANTPTVKLKWNVLPECNIDTTVTSLTLTNGNGVLPIKWNRRLVDGKYNIQERMFDAGVELIAGEESKYVHLVWADGIDSAAIKKTPITTRAAEAFAKEAIILDVSPATVSMDPVVGGATKVSYSGIDMVIVDQSRVEAETNIDKGAIPLVMEKPGALIFKWNTLGPPTRDFIATVTLYAGEVYKDLYIKYTINPQNPTYWEYLYCIPEQNTHIPAKNASVRVYVKTNAKWGLNSLQSSFPAEENATSLGTKLLAIDIDDNPGPNMREVKVNVNSDGTQKEVLTFIQEAPDATFEFLSANPEDNTIVTGGTLNVTIKVRTNHEWWIQYGGKKYNFEAGPLGIKEGSILIPANTNDEVRNLTVIVGYDDKVGKIINYYQEPSNGGDGTSFDFISANPATNATISSMGATAIVKVNTDYEWWIQINGVKTAFAAGMLGEKVGTINIPANTTTNSQVVTYTVGYGNITAQTINYIQSGAGSDTRLTYVSSNLPTGNIPQTGGTYQLTFTGTYTGGVQLRALFDGVAQAAGAVATNKKPEISVAANNGEVRNVTFEYKLDIGDWMALPTLTNRKQDAGNGGGDTETLNYVSSNLPTENIPAAGSVYTFNFEGAYTGQLRVRVINAATGGVLLNGPIGTTHSPKVTVPANTATATRNIKFQYRLINVENSLWVDLPVETNRIQDGTGTTPPGPSDSPSHSPITPEGDIPGAGGTYSCVFFNYVGTVYFRAVSGQGRPLDDSSGAITTSGAAQLSLEIPTSSIMNDNQVIFQYSIDSIAWTTMETRTQLVKLFVSNGIRDLPQLIPTAGGTYIYTSQGQLSGTLTILCKDDRNEILSESRGVVGSTINVNVPANTTGKTRSVFFYFKRPDIPTSEYYMTYTQQNGF